MGGDRNGLDATGLVICSGKDCSRERGFADLVATAASVKGSVLVPCQGLCHGPVAGVSVKGHVRWYERAAKGSIRKLLVATVRSGKPPKALRSLEVRKRRGTVRGSRRARAVV